MNAISVLLWVPALAIKGVLALMGLAIVPMAIGTRYMTLEPVVDRDHWPELFWLWGNDEEGCPDWWREYVARRALPDVTGLWSALEWLTVRVQKWFPEWWWYAIRNPVNNHRFLFRDVNMLALDVNVTNWPKGIPMESAEIVRVGKTQAWYFRRKGLASGFRYVRISDDRERYFELWFGWKLASPVPGLGLTHQLRSQQVGR